MHFPNMGGKQNIEGRFLGLCCERSVVRKLGCSAVFDSMVKFTNCESCESDRWALFCSSVSRLHVDKKSRSKEESKYRDGLLAV